jgi:integrase
MAFRMAALIRSKSGSYKARKGIPKDVQAEYYRLYGQRYEAKLTLSATLKPPDAKARLGTWVAEIETRIATIRAAQCNDRQTLTQKQAHGLSGEWYRWFIRQYEEAPGIPERWDQYFWLLIDRLEEYAPASVLASSHKTLEWARDPEVREDVRSLIAKEAKAEQFLLSKGLSLTTDAFGLFLDCLLENLVVAVLLLEQRARGDYSVDERLQSFPTFEPLPKQRGEVSELTPWELFEAWVDVKKPEPSTVDRWRGTFTELTKHFAGRSAASITTDEAQKWIEGLVNEDRSAATVSGIWRNAGHAVFAWAVSTRRLTVNPFKGVKIAIPRKKRTREKAFRPEEVALILNASLNFIDTRKAFDAARRWVPWICAYTGARAGEVTQLRDEDLVKREGQWAIQITPEAGSVKTGEARTVPLHGHLVEQGFVEFACGNGKGPLFYNADTPSKAKTDDPTNPPKPRSVRTRERIADWVRSVGVTDKAVQPNHAWRHTFKQIADRVNISEKLSDAITGHAPANVARSYGAPSVGDMAEALKKFPRYEIGKSS